MKLVNIEDGVTAEPASSPGDCNAGNVFDRVGIINYFKEIIFCMVVVFFCSF